MNSTTHSVLRVSTYSFSETAVMDVPLPELFVAFDCASLPASSEAVLVVAALHKGLKIWKPPPTHEHGSCCEVQKKGVGRVEKAQNASASARRLQVT